MATPTCREGEIIARNCYAISTSTGTRLRTENTSAPARLLHSHSAIDLRIPNGASVQDSFDEVGKIVALYHEHNIPFSYDDEWDLLLLRMKCRRIRDATPLTPYSLHRRWHRRAHYVTTTFHMDPELLMNNPRNLGQGDAPQEILVMTDEEGLKHPPLAP